MRRPHKWTQILAEEKRKEQSHVISYSNYEYLAKKYSAIFEEH